MKKLITVVAATLALVLVAFTPDPASAGRGWKGGHWHVGHWRGGGHWRGPRYANRGWGGPRYAYRGWRGPRYAYRGWGGYRGWRGYGWGWGGVGVRAPGVAINIGGYGRRCWSRAYGYYPCRYRWGY